jgi:acetylornithine deacetylase/succinyl-diaminopimelate desuccinylase-like protein
MACLRDVFGEEPYFLSEGGSIGAVASFDKVLGRPIVLLGFTNPDDHAHSPNESFVLANYEGGIRTIARYWEALASG